MLLISNFYMKAKIDIACRPDGATTSSALCDQPNDCLITTQYTDNFGVAITGICCMNQLANIITVSSALLIRKGMLNFMIYKKSEQ